MTSIERPRLRVLRYLASIRQRNSIRAEKFAVPLQPPWTRFGRLAGRRSKPSDLARLSFISHRLAWVHLEHRDRQWCLSLHSLVSPERKSNCLVSLPRQLPKTHGSCRAPRSSAHPQGPAYNSLFKRSSAQLPRGVRRRRRFFDRRRNIFWRKFFTPPAQ